MPTPRPLAQAIALAAAGVALSAQAQNASQNSENLSTVTVTAQAATKTETPFNETPQSVSLITQEEIREQGSESVQEATRYTAGVFTGQYGATGGRYDAIKLRGFGSDSIDNQYLDGLKLLNDKGTYSIFQIDPYFLESIEVVKGPSSVLYGRAAPGGLVALTSKLPQFTSHRQVQASVGTQGHLGAGFDIGGQVGDSGRAAYRVVGLVKDADSQWDHVENERYAIAPSLALDIGDSTSLTLMAYLQKDPEGGYYGGLPADGTLYSHNGKRISNSFYDGEEDYETFDREQAMVGYQLEHRFNDTWTGRQNLRYIHSDVDYGQVYNTSVWSGDELGRTYFGADEELSALAVDNQLIADFDLGDTQHTVLTGLDYQHRDTDAEWSYGSGFSSINPFNPTYGSDGTIVPFSDNDRELEQTGVYLQDQIALGQWRLTLGGRYDWVDIENESENLASGTTSQQQLDDESFSGRAALLYQFDNGLSPYISYSESFSPSSNVDESGDLIEPSDAEQVELGLKYQPNGTSDQYSIAVFQIDQDNTANYIQDIQAYRAVGSTRSRGLELEADKHITEDLAVRASYTYTDVEIQESEEGNEGKTPVATPEHMASVWGSYRFQEGALSGLTTGLGVRYIGDSWANESNTLEVPDYTLVDASLKYDLSQVGLNGVTAQLNVNNLFDKEYIGACYSESRCYFGAERSVKATVSYDF
ncbi:Ferrichrome-iron receptor precursor [Halomonas sp. THAF12]|uniref:TonB-dependent siderophore receptor n=1 Tax=Halomonas sp. THAF12 TaxID=2587849 RepID=UPI0012679EC9|nr:TonB-dependent siderophore receptor [Halomonas sp. THAF12]QFT84285.1 Ferrichrome-iron receptor precursor [Halomonas sp. THAF12]